MLKATKKDSSKFEQLVTGDIWGQTNKLFKKGERKTACIAYVTSEALELSKGDILICDASDYEIKFGSTTAKALDAYFKKGVTIYTNPVLHAKLLVSDKFLVIGSANLTGNSANTLIETAAITKNDTLLSQAKAFCFNLTSEKETILLTRAHIDRLLKIKVVKRSVKPAIKSNVRKKRFGDKYWYILLHTMSDRQYKRVEHTIDASEKKVLLENELEDEDISSVYFGKVTGFTSSVKVGDQILINLQNIAKTRRYIYPFATVLAVDRIKNVTVIVHEQILTDNRYSPQTFLAFTKKLQLTKPLGLTRGKEILKEDATTLKKSWKS